MENPLEKELERIGLNEKEAKVYLAGLALGQATAQQLAAKATVARPSTYIAIESLTQKGLMSSFQKGKRKMFVAADAKHLSFVIEAKRKQLEEQEEVAKRIAERLEKRATKSESSEISAEVHEGHAAIAYVQGLLREHSGSEAFEIFNEEDVRRFIPPNVSEEDARRDFTKRFKVKTLCIAPARTPELDTIEGVEGHWLPIDEFPFSGEILVFGTTVVFTMYSDTVRALVIKSKEFSNSMRTMGRVFWNTGT